MPISVWIVLPVVGYGVWVWLNDPMPIPLNEWKTLRSSAQALSAWQRRTD